MGRVLSSVEYKIGQRIAELCDLLAAIEQKRQAGFVLAETEAQVDWLEAKVAQELVELTIQLDVYDSAAVYVEVTIVS
jgi:hypothetical protein